MLADWSDLVLRLIRAAGALASALAGIAALLTDGAFVKRDPPPQGRWKDFPFVKYHATRWGGFLLAVILVAPVVQFIGDWMKDTNDAKSQQETANRIRQDIDSTVNTSTERSREDIIRTVGTVISEEQVLSTQTSGVAKGAGEILTGINRSLYPFTNITWAYEVRLNLEHPKMRSFRDFMHAKAEEALAGPGSHLEPGEMGGTSDNAADLYRPRNGATRLLVKIDSPYLKTSDPSFGAILGYDVFVDIFKVPPAVSNLSSLRFRSPDYSVSIWPYYNGDTYGMARSGAGFPSESFRIFQLIYIPSEKHDPRGDQCFVDYYWDKLEGFDTATERTRADISGLPDLADSSFVVRLETLSTYWGNESPYSLETLRMRVGAQELTFTSKDFVKPVFRNSLLIYRKPLPKDFDSVLRLFETVRSPLDTKPLTEYRLGVKPPQH